ncbi:MAG: AbrB/MazE/SpoVT family DNA-binding domain-containing protein [Janthinobacterium lividum]
MQVQIQRTDEGILILIPNDLAASCGLVSSDIVEVRRENGHLVVINPDEPHYDIEELLEGMTAEHLHAEIRTGPPRGNEVW